MLAMEHLIDFSVIISTTDAKPLPSFCAYTIEKFQVLMWIVLQKSFDSLINFSDSEHVGNCSCTSSQAKQFVDTALCDFNEMSELIAAYACTECVKKYLKPVNN